MAIDSLLRRRLNRKDYMRLVRWIEGCQLPKNSPVSAKRLADRATEALGMKVTYSHIRSAVEEGGLDVKISYSDTPRRTRPPTAIGIMGHTKIKLLEDEVLCLTNELESMKKLNTLRFTEFMRVSAAVDHLYVRLGESKPETTNGTPK